MSDIPSSNAGASSSSGMCSRTRRGVMRSAASINASYRNGVLEIEIPKKEESKPRQIQINVNADKQLAG